MARYNHYISNEKRLKSAKVLVVVFLVLGLLLAGGILLFDHDRDKLLLAMVGGGALLALGLLALVLVVEAKSQIEDQQRANRSDGDYSKKEGEYSK